MTEIKWDLSIAFNNNEAAKLFITECDKELQNVQKSYPVLLNKTKLSAKEFSEFLTTVNDITEKVSGVSSFAYNQSAQDQTVKESLSLQNDAENLSITMRKILTSIRIKISKMLLQRKDLVTDKELKNYTHFLEKVLDRAKYMLSDSEEEIILEKDKYGKGSWSKLQSQWLSSREFTIMDKGEEKKVTWGDYYRYTQSPDHSTRKSAMINMVGEKGLAKDKEIFAAALRSICGDHISTYKRRGHPSTFTSSILTNDITQKMLDQLLSVVQDSTHLYEEFCLLKAKILETKKLRGEDLWVPIQILPEEEQKITWEEAKNTILTVYNNFDEEIGSIAEKMFNENHIDASSRKGKRAGAYCSDIRHIREALILMSFTDSLSSVSTLSHEMGHAVHSYLSNQLKSLNDSLSYAIAETASEFGRFLLVDHQKKSAKSELMKKFILFNHLEELAIVIYEVGSRTVFEKSLYDAIEAGTYLDAEKISDLFVKARKQFFGDGIDFLPEQRYDWIWKPHYYRTDLRYYNYPYYFAELLVMAFFNTYKSEGKEFIPKFKDYLRSGGSKSALDLGKDMGVDLESKEFWQKGIDEFEQILKDVKELFK